MSRDCRPYSQRKLAVEENAAGCNLRLSLRRVQNNMKLLFISLGCDKNLVDSEEMLGMLAADGHQIVDDEDEAEVIIVNTCCFIGDAKEESVNTILEMAEKKKAGTCKVLIVTGCMAQRYKKEISEEIPGGGCNPWYNFLR